jgi:hypothetical protein
MLETPRFIPLDAVRADGWFERLAHDNATFRQLCEVVGERFVAFSVLAGVRITAISVDRRARDASLVDFVLGDGDDEQRLPLVEFRRRLALALLAEEPPPPAVDDPASLDSEAIQELIGFRYVLLAALFGVRLEALVIDEDSSVRVAVRIGEDEEVLRIEVLREVLRERVRAEADRSSTGSPFSIDLGLVPEAEAALDDANYERTIELLGAWPGPLSILLRTAEGQRLSPEVRATLARSLGLLGTAYARTGRGEWAEEVLRLGIQWGQDGPAVGDLFRRMGESCAENDRHGEAIGLLRRALTLGAPPRDVLPLLARSYAERSKWVACALCAEEAMALGAERDEAKEEGHDVARPTLGELLERAEAVLGDAWRTFRERVPASKPKSDTIPVPSGEGT